MRQVTNDTPIGIRATYGMLGKREYPTSTEYQFGGYSFTLQNEWDDLCLIAGAAENDDILQNLHDALNTEI